MKSLDPLRLDHDVMRADAVEKPKCTVTLELEGDIVKTLPKFLLEVRRRAAVGHGFEICGDHDMETDYGKLGCYIDGDGNARIAKITVDSEEL